MRPSVPVDAHLRALRLARRCVVFDARPQTIALVADLALKEVTKYFPSVRHRSGRFPSSPEWFHTRNLLQRTEASILLSLYRRIRDLGFPAQEALLSGFQRYRETLFASATIDFDRAFNLVCHLDGLWLVRERSFDLYACRSCRSQYLVPRSSGPAGGDCIFCKLVQRYLTDVRLQARFPARPLPNVEALRLAFPIRPAARSAPADDVESAPNCSAYPLDAAPARSEQ
jgi:hypothetical protein